MILIIIPIVGLFVFGGVWLFQLLWNALLPDLFNAPVISYWQSFGVCILLSFIGSFFSGNK